MKYPPQKVAQIRLHMIFFMSSSLKIKLHRCGTNPPCPDECWVSVVSDGERRYDLKKSIYYYFFYRNFGKRLKDWEVIFTIWKCYISTTMIIFEKKQKVLKLRPDLQWWIRSCDTTGRHPQSFVGPGCPAHVCLPNKITKHVSLHYNFF